MAPLIASRSTRKFRSARPLTPSPQLQMPHVFIIPPEEEQQENPPWCCFDADERPEPSGDSPSNSDPRLFDIPYPLQPSENDVSVHTLRHTFVHRPRPRKLEKKQRPEAVKIIETKPSLTRQKDPRDSDVIEVVKVKRTREAVTDLEENTQAKRSRTLRARASKALLSIKNVGKGSHGAHVKDIWTSSESMPGIFKGIQGQIRSQDHKEQRPLAASSRKGSLSRSNSLSLSQIFQPMKPSRSDIPLTVETPVSPDAQAMDPLSREYHDTNSSFIEIPDTPMSEDTSPNHTMKGKNVAPRFSVRELHRLFTFSSSPNDPSLSNTILSTTSSTSLLRHPDAPREGDSSVDVHPVDLGTAGRKLASRLHQAFQIHPKNDNSRRRRLSDLSFEMKLDSLHFDALSFDPEEFDVSMEGNVLR